MNNKNERHSFSFKEVLLLISFGIILFSLIQNIGVAADWLKKFIGFFSPVITGLCIAFVLNVPLTLFEDKIFRKMKKSEKKAARVLCRPLSLVCAVLLCLGIIAVLLLVIIPDLKTTLPTLAATLPSLFTKAVNWVEGLLERFNIATENMPNIRIDWQKFFGIIEDFLTNDSGHIVGGAVNMTTSIIGGAMNLVFSIIIAIYILAKKEDIGVFTRRALHSFLPEKAENTIYHIASLTNRSFSSFITGQLTEAVILGVLCFIGMKIFGFPYAPVISVIICITAIVPIIGAVVGEVMGMLFIMIVSPIKSILFLAFMLVLQQIEGSLIYPKVVGKSVGLPSILVMSAVLVGGNIGGVVGALIGVPVCAVLYVLFKEIVAARLEKKELAAQAEADAGLAESVPEEPEPEPVAPVAEAKTEASPDPYKKSGKTAKNKRKKK